jgi:hypothetical protein
LAVINNQRQKVGPKRAIANAFLMNRAWWAVGC